MCNNVVTLLSSRVYSQRDVSAANFVMHEVHCARNITCCPQCNEPVPRSNLEEHIEENHKQVICKLCRKQMECCLLEDHMVSCTLCISCLHLYMKQVWNVIMYVCVYVCCVRV